MHIHGLGRDIHRLLHNHGGRASDNRANDRGAEYRAKYTWANTAATVRGRRAGKAQCTNQKGDFG